MAEIVKTFTPAGSSPLTTPNPVDGATRSNHDVIAGEALGAFDACYIKSDGKAWKSIGTTLNAAAAKVDGYAFVATSAGRPVTLYYNCEAAYGPANLTPGKRLFLSGTVAGGLADAASTGGTGSIGHVVCNKSGTSIVFLTKSSY